MKISKILNNKYNVRDVPRMIEPPIITTSETLDEMTCLDVITLITFTTRMRDRLSESITQLEELLDSGVTTEDCLIDEFKGWCADNNMPDRSADELLCLCITDAQRTWLLDFIVRWSAMINKGG